MDTTYYDKWQKTTPWIRVQTQSKTILNIDAGDHT